MCKCLSSRCASNYFQFLLSFSGGGQYLVCFGGTMFESGLVTAFV